MVSMVDHGGDRYIPEEIITDEILTRLPAASAVRFKRVCKQWCKSISSPSFVKLHLDRSRCLPPSKLNIRLPECKLSSDVSFWTHASRPYPSTTAFAMHSCDGLIVVRRICTVFSKSLEFGEEHFEVYVCNPVISYAILPPPPPIWYSWAFLFHDDLVNRYKLLVMGFMGFITSDVYLFDFTGSSSWEKLTIPDNVLESWKDKKSVVLKGCLYSLSTDIKRSRVLSFDITSGDTHLIKTPYDVDFKLLAAIEGGLYGLQCCGDCYIIWVLLLHNLEWAIFHSACKMKTKTKCNFHLVYNNFIHSSISSPHNAATVVKHIMVLCISDEIQQDSEVIAHMDTLVSLDDK